MSLRLLVPVALLVQSAVGATVGPEPDAAMQPDGKGNNHNNGNHNNNNNNGNNKRHQTQKLNKGGKGGNGGGGGNGGDKKVDKKVEKKVEKKASSGEVNEWPNLVYIKVPKTASSTFGGIIRRLGTKHGLDNARSAEWISKEPGVWATHSARWEIQKKLKKLNKPTFTVSILRDPVDRCLSEFYHFKVQDAGVKPTAENKLKALKDCSNYMARYLLPDQSADEFLWLNSGGGNFSDAAQKLGGGWDDDETVTKVARTVMEKYDFLGVDTRFDETVFLLAQMLGVNASVVPKTGPASLNDVLYIDAKVSGGNTSTVTYTHPPLNEEPKEVQEYANGAEFKLSNALDYKLIELVTADIDGNITYEDPDLALFRLMRTSVEDVCQEHAVLLGPKNCYYMDNGCGYPCMDEYVANGSTTARCESYCPEAKEKWTEKCHFWLDCHSCTACGGPDEPAPKQESPATSAPVVASPDGTTCMDPASATAATVAALPIKVQDEITMCAGISDCVAAAFCKQKDNIVCSSWKTINCDDYEAPTEQVKQEQSKQENTHHFFELAKGMSWHPMKTQEESQEQQHSRVRAQHIS